MERIARVYATVTLRPAEEARSILRAIEEHPERYEDANRLIERLREREHDDNGIELVASMSAEDTTGHRVHASGGFVMSGPRRGLAAIAHRYRGPQLSADPLEHEEILARTYRMQPSDIEDRVNQMLGRDPELHRPPRLAWDRLIEALAAEGVRITEHELIETPLTMELDPEVTAALEAP
jgi:hypothetical protein